MSDRLQVLVIGGGIGGLCLAQGIRMRVAPLVSFQGGLAERRGAPDRRSGHLGDGRALNLPAHRASIARFLAIARASRGRRRSPVCARDPSSLVRVH